MKRKLKWIGVVLAVLVVGFGVTFVLLPRDRITVDSYNKIRIGMTEKEAEEILGGPGIKFREAERKYGKHFRGREIQLEDRVGEQKGKIETDTKLWIGRRQILFIDFDQSGHVRTKHLDELRSADSSFLDRLRDWLGW
jgi:hypothetical protein